MDSKKKSKYITITTVEYIIYIVRLTLNALLIYNT